MTQQNGDGGRRVYLSVNKFNATGELHIRSDGTKQVNFTDNNGQVRVLINGNEAIEKKYFDYKPFGGLAWSSDNSHLREGLDGSIFVHKSGLQLFLYYFVDKNIILF